MKPRFSASQDYEYMKEAHEIAKPLLRYILEKGANNEQKIRGYLIDFLKNIGTLFNCVRETDFSLSVLESQLNPVLEFYFDVYDSKKSVCFISKGWGDPGVRIGDNLYINQENIEKFEENIMDIMNQCSKEGACLSINPNSTVVKGGLELLLWTPLYIDALTPKGLKDAISSLTTCEERIYKLCPFTK